MVYEEGASADIDEIKSKLETIYGALIGATWQETSTKAWKEAGSRTVPRGICIEPSSATFSRPI